MVVPAAEVDGDERAPRLDQPAGQQAALAPAVPAVAVAQPRVFLADVERPPRRRPADELERLLGEAVHRLLRVGRLDGARHRVEVRSTGRGGLRAARAQAGREVQVVDLEVGGVGVAAGHERVVRGAEEVAAEVAGRQADAAGVRHGDVAGHPALAGADLAVDDGADAGELPAVVRAADAHVLGREHPVAAGEVVAGVVVQRAHHRELVGDLRLLRDTSR